MHPTWRLFYKTGGHKHEWKVSALIFYSDLSVLCDIIKNPKGHKIITVYMVNMLGQEVFSARKFNEIKNELSLETNQLSTGAYIINVITDKGGVSKKVIAN